MQPVLGGTGAICYWFRLISLAKEEMYDNGELGFFLRTGYRRMDNMSTNVPIHAGFGEGFNKATYDIQCRNLDYMRELQTCLHRAHVFSI